jgi:hypothetical protein
LFTLDGDKFLVGVAKKHKNNQFDWLIREEDSNITVDYPLTNLSANKQLLYGSVSRDNSGSLYVVGVDMSNRRKHKPMIIRLY